MLSYSSGMETTARAVEMLRQTKPWVRLMAIITFIGVPSGRWSRFERAESKCIASFENAASAVSKAWSVT